MSSKDGGYFGARKRRAAWGSLPHRKPNRFRLNTSELPPLRYPEDVNDETLPYRARRELKDRIYEIWAKHIQQAWLVIRAEAKALRDLIQAEEDAYAEEAQRGTG